MNVPPFIEAQVTGGVNKVIEVAEAIEVMNMVVEFIILIHVLVVGVGS